MNRVQRAIFALLIAAIGEPAYCQFDLPTAAIRLENDTYTSAIAYLQSGDRLGAMNLINRDPLAARFALIRLLRDPETSEIAHTFAELFAGGSRSELEIPLTQFYDKLPTSQGVQFLGWIEAASRAEYVVSNAEDNKFWDKAVAQAIQNLEEAGRFFKASAFPTGEAFCLRIRAVNRFRLATIPSTEEAQQLYASSRSIYETGRNTRGEALALSGLTRIYVRSGQPTRAKEYLTEAIRITRTTGDKIAELYLLTDFPNISSTIDEKKAAWKQLESMPALASLKYSFLFILAGRQHDAESRQYFEMVDKMLADETDPIRAAKTNWDFANHLVFDGSYDYDGDKGIPYINRAVEIERRLAHDPGAAVARMLWLRGNIELGHLQYSRAESTYLEALASLMRSPDRSDLSGFLSQQSFLLLELAWTYEATGDYVRAIDKARESLAIAEQIEFRAYIVQARSVLARIHVALGDLQLAEEELTKATQVRTRIANEAFTTLSEIHLNSGFYAKALNALDQLDKQFREQRPGAGAISIFQTGRLRLLALTWLRIGDLAKAMQFAKGAEARPSEQAIEIEEGLVGMVLMEMRKYADAEKYFISRFATTPSGPRGLPPQADAHKNLGRIYRVQNRAPEAIEHLTAALGIYRMMNRRKDELEILIELAQVALKGGKPSDARPYLEQALQLANEGRWPQAIWSVRAARADLAKAERNTGDAIEELKSALAAVESVSARMKSELTRSAFIENKVTLYDDLIRLIGSSSSREAFEYAERRRAQSFIDGAQRQGLRLAASADHELFRKRNEVEIRLIGKQKVLEEQLSKPPAARNKEFIAALNRDLDIIRSEHLELLRRIAEEYPVEASRQGVVTAIAAGDVQRDILKPGDALLEYVVTSRDVFAFVITPGQCRFIRLPVTAGAIAQQIQQLLTPFSQLRSGHVDLLHLNYDLTLAHRLYDELILPLEPFIRQTRRLIIVPDDVLNYLPFESLVRSPSAGRPQPNIRYAQYRDVDWLVNHYTIVYAISATSLHPRFRQTKPVPESMLSFGNPKLGANAVKNATLRSAAMDVYMPALGSLPQSAREAATVAQMLRPKVQTTVLTGEQARKSEFIRRGPSAGYVHFAVHSLIDEQQPYYSALVLSPEPESDGLLQTYEIMKTELNARLVTLSSCDTALGKLYKGEGLLDLRRAFLMAGAESVVVSFWSIDDSTAGFMELFYGNISRGQSIGDALRNSKLQYLRKEMSAGTERISLSHPFFWAPFALSSTSIR